MERKPSPKPIRRPQVGVRSIWRIPDKGAVTPRLRDGEAQTNAIGFVTDLCRPFPADDE